MAEDHRGRLQLSKRRSRLGLGLLIAGLSLLGWQESAAAGSVTFRRITRSSHPSTSLPSRSTRSQIRQPQIRQPHIHRPHTHRNQTHYRGKYQAPNRKVLVEFVALGKDWGRVELDNQLIYHPQNHNRRHQVYLSPGAYYLEVTGITPFDAWASGYLDVGRDDANVIVVYLSKDGGVQASSPYTWIPDVGRSRY